MTPCYSPLSGWLSRTVNLSGKRSVVFNLAEGFADKPMIIPCGQCIGCRLERSRQWAIRCVHESMFHRSNCFITLTYNDDNLPLNGSLDKRALQLFFKRLRKRIGVRCRYFACGEYGLKLGRPHYHVILFGYDFPDRKFLKYNYKTRCAYYRSFELELLWPYGFSTIGELTFESVAYTARYCMKKINGDKASLHYMDKVPEFCLMSRRPGIAKDFFDKYMNDIYPHDYVVIRDGEKCRPPKYYDMLLELTEKPVYDSVKINRKKRALQFRDNSSIGRLYVRHYLKDKSIELLKRSYEDE